MTEWSVFLVIGEIIAFILCVAKPMLNLNTSIVKLMEAVKSLSEKIADQRTELKEFEDRSREDHSKFQDHFERVDNRLENHEQRISRIEGR